MAWTRRTPKSATAAATTMVVDTPTGVADGDIMCLEVFAATTSSTITVTGWTSTRTQTGNGKIWSFRRIASSEPANYTVNASPAEDMAGAMDAYAGGDTTTPINTSNGAANSGTTAAQTSASITTTVDGCMIRAVFCADSNASHLPATPDASPVATERAEVFQTGGNLNLYVEDYEQPTQGAITLDMTWGSSLTLAGVTQIYALAPTAGGGGGATPALRTVQSNLRW
jgi:hypothetical protein